MAVLTRVTVPSIMQLNIGDTVQLSLEAQTRYRVDEALKVLDQWLENAGERAS